MMTKAVSSLPSGKQYSQNQPTYKKHCQCIVRKDAAQLLGITPTTYDHLTRFGKLKFSRCHIGKKLQGYSRAEIVAFLRTYKIVKNRGRYLVVSKTFEPYTLF